MKSPVKSIRPFVGAKNFAVSRAFYTDLGFEEIVLETKLSLFKKGDIAFYLQDAYVKDWIDNTMIFVEVDNVEDYWKELVFLNLTEKYTDAKLVPIRTMDWGKECFVHDPSGILWHFGEFFTQ
ncbi:MULTISPECIES: VOC family protein [Chryseobacterium]|uniref:glyoxalase n=1 Tax=Chryseobacterium TaxID=59732 RepID=UPI001BEC7C76|nr:MULTISPECIES: glyoxalase [Chryseobacterium]MBT2619718.1 glyoxalase [Chryseobacterium sp. ISL-6]